MSWEDRVSLNARFRDVSFLYQDVEGEVGRRTVTNEFPGRDQPFVEDLGRRTRKFTIEAIVIGPDYDVQRDRLRAALEEPGPGELAHPYWGLMTVTVEGGVRVRESTKERGLARFTITFLETGGELRLATAPDTETVIKDAATHAADIIQSRFAALFSVANAITEVADEAVALVQTAMTTVNAVKGQIAAALLVVGEVADVATAAVLAVTDGIATLIHLPLELAQAVMGAYHAVLDGVTAVTAAFDDLTAFFGVDGTDALPHTGSALENSSRVAVFIKAATALGTVGDGLPVLPETTSQQVIAAENQRQLVRLFKLSLAVEAARLAATLTFDNLDQTVQARGLVADLLDAQLADEHLPDELYAPLYDLRATVVDHLSQAAAALPPLEDLTPPVTVPSLVLAYRVYGDPRREVDILVRNPQLRDPTAVPGGQALKVLRDE